MQHSLVVKARSVESYSDGTPSVASLDTQTKTTPSQPGLRSSSTWNMGSNHWLRNNNLILRSVIFHYFLFQTVTPETNKKQNLGESESCSLFKLWFPFICQKTEFLLNCSILWQFFSVLHHHLHCHNCSLEALVLSAQRNIHIWIRLRVRCRRVHFSPHRKSTNRWLYQLKYSSLSSWLLFGWKQVMKAVKPRFLPLSVYPCSWYDLDKRSLAEVIKNWIRGPVVCIDEETDRETLWCADKKVQVRLAAINIYFLQIANISLCG